MYSSFENLRDLRIPLFSAFVVALLLGGCAAQGPPHPPRIEKPESIKDLAAFQVGRTIELTFTLPTLATDGEGLSKPLELELFRVVTPAGQNTGATAAQPQPWATLSPPDFSRYQQGEKIVYPDHLSDQEYSQWLGTSLTFTARGLTRGFRHRAIESELSNSAVAVLLDVSPAVEAPRCETTEHALELSWPAPTVSLSGQPIHDLAGYRVFRSDASKGPFVLRGEIRASTFRDRDFQFGHAYFYRVRALFRSGSQLAESEDSAPCSMTPRDIFPPAAPEGLSAISTAAGVELIWNANTAPDLAGYNVYRREGEGRPQKLNTELVGTPLYRDTGVEAEHRYTYWVTAVDTSGNESASSTVTMVEVH